MRSSYNVQEMIRQFKTHIWGILEYHNGSIAHASATSLARLDRLQSSFLEQLHMDERTAFLDYNFAPPSLRRDIGILGFLHKRILKQCHPALESFLPLDTHPSSWHNKQLHAFLDFKKLPRLLERSLVGKIWIYNRLHQSIVDINTVKGFQRELTRMARARYAANAHEWRFSFHTCSEMWKVRLMLQI